MKHQPIQKSPKSLGFTPNLVDYAKARSAFNPKAAEKEVEWFDSNHLNAAYNAVDKHLKTWRKNKVALYWEDEAGNKKQYSFAQLAQETNKFANILKKYDLNRNDRVFIF